jgi:hypothetical protein
MSKLEDFDIVAHVVPIKTDKTFNWTGKHAFEA